MLIKKRKRRVEIEQTHVLLKMGGCAKAIKEAEAKRTEEAGPHSTQSASVRFLPVPSTSPPEQKVKSGMKKRAQRTSASENDPP